jgi:3-dehydroquinate dehydratase
MKFTELPRPFIMGVISDGDVDHCVRTIKLSEFDGADGFQLELHNFKDHPPSKAQMKEVICSTLKPVWTTNRRRGTGKTTSEEERIKLELDSLDAGAACIDMEMDAFDPWTTWDESRKEKEWRHLHDIPVDTKEFPHECSFDEEAIRRQKEVIEQVHAAGAEVLLSCHLLIRARTEGILKIGKELEDRGADLVKIVVRNDDLYDLCDTLRANVLLKEKMRVPFKLMSQGEPSKLGRVLFPMFGSAWAFCQQDLRPGGFEYRPLISTEKFILQRVDWRPNYARHFK